MLTYLIIVIALGGGYAGWMGFRAANPSKGLRARMSARNQWLKNHTIAKQTDEAAKDAEAVADDDK